MPEDRMKRSGLLSLLLVLGLGLAGSVLLLPGGDGAVSAGPPEPAVRIAPAAVQADPGPQAVWGAPAGSTEGGKHFLWVDVSVRGDTEACRIYFDRKDNENYHYLQRRDGRITLGLCESGVEQILSECDTPDGEGGELRVARHGEWIGAFAGLRLVGSAFDDRRMGGSVGLRNYKPGATPILDAKEREDIHFASDFMRLDSDNFAWRTYHCGPGKGEFSIKTMRNPLLSQNAFNYMGAGHEVFSVAGEPWWDNYRYQVAVRGPVEGKLGLIFAFQDENNYGLFRWSARRTNPDGSTLSAGLRELVLVRNGEAKVVQQAPGGYLPSQWYKAEALVSHERARILIDGHALFEVSSPYLTTGAVGVWCDVALPEKPADDPEAQPFSMNSMHDLMNQHAVFDDVKVDSVAGIADDFRSPGPLMRGWLRGTGNWEVQPVTNERLGGELHAEPGAGASKSLIGNRGWSQYRLACDVDPGKGKAGLVLLYLDESDYYLARTTRSELELVHVAGGREQVLDRSTVNPAPADDGYLRLSARIKRGHIQVQAKGQDACVEYYESGDALRGRAGLFAAQAPARFRRFRLAFFEESQPLVTSNAIFGDESSMQDWTDPKEDWDANSKELMINNEAVKPIWNRNQFPGDVELTVEPREILDPNAHTLALSVSKDGGQSANQERDKNESEAGERDRGKYNGYVFKYEVSRSTTGATKDERLARVTLIRQGQTVQTEVLPGGPVSDLATASLRRAGRYIIGTINGRSVVVFRDENPLTGTKVAYVGQGLSLKTEATKIQSEGFTDEEFATAPSNWRTAGCAIAEIANRWQCDPRWSFFSLKSDLRAKDLPNGKVAVLWNKNLYPGDVTVEFFVGNKMEAERGRPYAYARDINVTICSDGKDLTKGYTFMFGGRNNAGSMILRNGVEVRNNSEAKVPTSMRYHRHWFEVRVEKRGNTVRFRVDNYFNSEKGQVLEWEDPNPLTGNQIAIWTYDHAIMISRVQVSGEGGTETEPPDRDYPPVKTIYDQQ